MMQRMTSNGYVRNKLTVLHGGAGRAPAAAATALAAADNALSLAIPIYASDDEPPWHCAWNASAPPASKATKATAAPNAATSP